MTSEPFAAASSVREYDLGEIARLLAEGGDERIALDPQSGRNLYGCGVQVWTGGPTFSSTTASPLSADGLRAVQDRLDELSAAAAPRELAAAAAEDVRRRLAALCGLGPDADADIILAPSGTDLHHIAAACAGAARRGGLVAVMPDPRESGRGVERAVRGLAYAAAPPFARAGGEAPAHLAAGLIPIALRTPDGAARPLAEIDAETEAACARAARTGGAVLLVLLDVSKTGLAAPSPACAAGLKARYGEQLTVLVDACQFRLGAAAVREHLRRDFLVAVTGSKFLGGPPFSGALLVPQPTAERLRDAPAPWRELAASAREDWPQAYAGRALLPRAFSLGPALRWAPALDNFAALATAAPDALRRFVAAFGDWLGARLAEQPAAFAALDPERADEAATIFPLLLKRNGRLLDAEAVAAVHARLRDLAHARHAGHLWIGQPVAVGRTESGPLSAVRLALSAPLLAAYAQAPDGVSRLAAQADACLWEIARVAGTI
jgi:selenocysteine lyase/cysteine desulfurase